MSVIRVQGETYQTAADLLQTIHELEAKLFNMPSDTPEHSDLNAHLDRLNEAYREAVGTEPGQAQVLPFDEEGNQDVPQRPPDEPAPEPVEEELEDEGAYCPVCGQELAEEIPVPLDPNTEQCADCKGFGKTLTGSRVPGHVVRDCPTCQGQGWLSRLAEPVVRYDLPQQREQVQPLTQDARRRPDGTFDPPIGAVPLWQGATWNPQLGGWQ